MLPWIRLYKRNPKKVIKTIACLFLVTFFVFAFATLTHAQAAGDAFGVKKVGSLLPLGGEDIRVIAAKIIRIGLSLLGIIAVGLILYAGFTWMTSGGNEEKIATAKKTLINATIGLAIIMSSFAITQFILNALQNATGSGGSDEAGGRVALNFDSYYASGSLGRSIRDHYPLRDQRDVPRNAGVIVTFREAVDPKSLIKDTNNNTVFGDCINVNDPAFDWGPRFCDQLSTSSVKINISGSTSTPAVEAAAITIPEGANGDAFTFTFRPLRSLGSDQVKTDYVVDLTNNILKKDGRTSVFANERHGHYMWKFQTDIKEDKTPPFVTSVYPEAGTTQPRNSLVQVNFNEPMAFDASVLSNMIFGSANVTGVWKPSNGYKTFEFTSDIPCGQNSCGETMYCLPVVCGGEANCSNPYGVLLRTALVLGGGSFESVPFSGVIDNAGNALDNGPLNVADGVLADPHRPGFVQGEANIIHEAEKAPDNYYWSFAIANSIDRASPAIEQVTPNLDAEGVDPSAALTLKFNRRLSNGSLGDISLEEYPLPASLENVNPAFANLGDIWFRPSASIIEQKTLVTVDHRQFGPQGTNFYYFPIIPSNIKSITQNCLYPGRGPWSANHPQGDISPVCAYSEDADGNVVQNNGCIPFPNGFTSEQDTGCVQYTNPGQSPVFSSTSTCLNTLKSNQISPLQPVVGAGG